MQQADRAHTARPTAPSGGKSREISATRDGAPTAPDQRLNFEPKVYQAPSRRALLAGCGVALATPALAAPGLLSKIGEQPPQAPARERWERLRRTYEAAQDRHRAYEAKVYAPAMARLDRLTGPVPELSVTLTASSGSSVRFLASEAELVPGLPFYEPVRELKRARDAWAIRYTAAERRPEFATVIAEEERLSDAAWAARSALMRAPAPDAGALAFKLALALDEAPLIDADRAALAADAERMAA